MWCGWRDDSVTLLSFASLSRLTDFNSYLVVFVGGGAEQGTSTDNSRRAVPSWLALTLSFKHQLFLELPQPPRLSCCNDTAERHGAARNKQLAEFNTIVLQRRYRLSSVSPYLFCFLNAEGCCCCCCSLPLARSPARSPAVCAFAWPYRLANALTALDNFRTESPHYSWKDFIALLGRELDIGDGGLGARERGQGWGRERGTGLGAVYEEGRSLGSIAYTGQRSRAPMILLRFCF